MADWTPTSEMVEAGVQAVWEATMRTPVMYQTHHSERAREVRAALTAAYHRSGCAAAEQAWLLLDHAHTLGLNTTGDPQ